MDLRLILITIVATLIISMLLGPLFIPLLRKLKFGQSILKEAPKGHQKKAGTPTMGGIIIVISLVLGVWQYIKQSENIALLLFATSGFALIGFFDDFIKIIKKRSLGLTAKQKLFGQLIISILLFYFLLKQGHSTIVYLPNTNWGIDLGWLYLPLLILILLGTTNATNLTDGLDGLLSGSAAITFGGYAIIALTNMQFDIAIFSAAMIGAVLGFLVYNAHPAKVFMGDTGSLAIGGAIATLAVITKTELLLIIMGGVYVIETLSVILQVYSFKKHGRRIFRMSPIHYHFELSGWSEWRIVTFFWFGTLLFTALAVYIEVF